MRYHVASVASAPPKEWPVMNSGRSASPSSSGPIWSRTDRYASLNPRCTLPSVSPRELETGMVAASRFVIQSLICWVPRNASTAMPGPSSGRLTATYPCVSVPASNRTPLSSNPPAARHSRSSALAPAGEGRSAAPSRAARFRSRSTICSRSVSSASSRANDRIELSSSWSKRV